VSDSSPEGYPFESGRPQYIFTVLKNPKVKGQKQFCFLLRLHNIQVHEGIEFILNSAILLENSTLLGGN
jgi:hypothetical protein